MTDAEFTCESFGPISLTAIAAEARHRPVFIAIDSARLLPTVCLLLDHQPCERWTVLAATAEIATALGRERDAVLAADARRRDHDRERVNRATAMRRLAEADRELTALAAAAETKAGFFARLFGGGGPTVVIRERIADWQAVRTAAEAEIRRIDTRFSSGELDETTHASEEWCVDDRTPLPQIRNLPSPSMTEPYRNLTILTVEMLTADAAATIVAGADQLTTADFDRLPAAAIVLGDATVDSPFARQLRERNRPAWEVEAGRIVCRFAFDDVTAEPVIDEPSIEARFTAAGDLAAVVFPESWTAAACRRWLATNLDDARPVAFGPPAWTTGDRIVASWQSIAGCDVVESVPGVREFVKGTHATAATAAIEFDPDCGWTRDSADAWLRERIDLAVPAVIHVSWPTATIRAEPITVAG
jgi:hypothetical protein